MVDRIDEILQTPLIDREAGGVIGSSRERRAVRAFRIGKGSRRVSVIGGCHADEPVGPRFLRHLVSFLNALPPDDDLVLKTTWWIVPHVNPDGEARNRAWHSDDDEAYDIGTYLAHVVREPPGDDIEFGFPRSPEDQYARPENQAIFAWWQSAGGPFQLHVSLHGMAFAAGPWFLIDAAWVDRCEHLKGRCRRRVQEMGYVLHDVERRGEKGFLRLGRGFCTRPDSRAMSRFFVEQGELARARLFRPSSMEAMRERGGDALTLVSEMPLFLLPGVGESLGPPDPVATEWKARIDGWRAELQRGHTSHDVTGVARAAGLRPMPIKDQMALQWTFIRAGLEQVEAAEGSGPIS
jgi:hypothetical protein